MKKTPHWPQPSVFLLPLSMTAVHLTILLASSPTLAQASLNDVQGNWAQRCIRSLYQRNIISGYPDGSFRPNAAVTRAEFAAMVTRAFPNAAPTRNAIRFGDVPDNSWAFRPIQTATRTGFLSGYPNNVFRPNQNIPRVEVLVSLSNGLNYDPPRTVNATLNNSFNDVDAIPNYARPAIAAATERQLVVNFPNVRSLNPNQPANRADVSAFLCQALTQNSNQASLIPAQYIAQPSETGGR